MSEEILNYLENDKNYSVDCNDGSYYLELPYREAHEIKDLITNLQQENKQLKEDKKKAREWVKKNQYYFPTPTELLEILGEKENE